MQTTDSKPQALNPKLQFSFVFFGSSPISVTTLDALEKEGMLPKAVVTQPDKPQGRGHIFKPTPVKIWAEFRRIPIFTPNTLKDPAFISSLIAFDPSVIVLVSYGKIIPDEILKIPKKGIVNLHPSLLPKLRGPSPIEYTILNDMKDEVGVSIMLLDAKTDEGPILSQKKIEIPNWPPKRSDLYNTLASEGAELLAITLPLWMAVKTEPVEQDHSKATYSKMIEKHDAEIDLSADPYKSFLKIRAYEEWPVAFFFADHKGVKMRVKITDASFEGGVLKILRVIPEGKKEMSFEDFERGFRS